MGGEQEKGESRGNGGEGGIGFEKQKLILRVVLPVLIWIARCVWVYMWVLVCVCARWKGAINWRAADVADSDPEPNFDCDSGKPLVQRVNSIAQLEYVCVYVCLYMCLCMCECKSLFWAAFRRIIIISALQRIRLVFCLF